MGTLAVEMLVGALRTEDPHPLGTQVHRVAMPLRERGSVRAAAG